MNAVKDFMKGAKDLTRNPLGIIALFISLIYGIAGVVLSVSLNNLQGPSERLPIIWFIIIFPILVLGTFAYLVIKHHKKLYAPSDYKDEKNFISTFLGNSEVSSDLEKLSSELKSFITEQDNNHLTDKIRQIAERIEKIKDKSEEIPINNNGAWWLNHWGSDCASIDGDKMIFKGTSAPNGTDGSHIDLNNILEIGKTYEISCFAKSSPNTTGMFMLWCHDETGVGIARVNASTPYKTPPVEGEKVKLKFKAEFNKNIRIHLQYKPGQGQIEVSDLKISPPL